MMLWGSGSDDVVGKRQMEESRVAERYVVEAPVTITIDLGDRERTVLGRSVNISSAGALIGARNHGMEPGLRVRLEVLLCIRVMQEVFGFSDRARVRVSGYVVRIARGGLAVRFDKSYALEPARMEAHVGRTTRGTRRAPRG
jgi:hypothetical protein